MSEAVATINEEAVDVINGEEETALAIPEPVGNLQLTDAQRDILFAPPDEKSICIRPDGMIYEPWMEYATRLRNAFGLAWGLISEGNPTVKNNLILWKFSLYIQGQKMTNAYGEQEYRESNPNMSYGDAIEGAQSNALMRCCKHIGITNELWKPSFIAAWKEKYAERYWDPNAWDAKKEKKGKYLWRKKGAVDEKPEPEPTSEPEKREKSGEEICKEMYAGLTPEQRLKFVKDFNLKDFEAKHFEVWSREGLVRAYKYMEKLKDGSG